MCDEVKHQGMARNSECHQKSYGYDMLQKAIVTSIVCWWNPVSNTPSKCHLEYTMSMRKEWPPGRKPSGQREDMWATSHLKSDSKFLTPPILKIAFLHASIVDQHSTGPSTEMEVLASNVTPNHRSMRPTRLSAKSTTHRTIVAVILQLYQRSRQQPITVLRWRMADTCCIQGHVQQTSSWYVL